MTYPTLSHTALCMRGTIFTDQKCPICKATLNYDERRRGLFCPSHPEQQANRLFTVQFGRTVRKRFSDYREAERFLDGLRYEVDKGTFDPRDYSSKMPLSFTLLSTQWIEHKQQEVKEGSLKNLRSFVSRAQEHFGDKNVKLIDYAALEDFFSSQKLSNKTKSNLRSCLHSFWTWILNRKVISRSDFPDFPNISFELGWRKTVDKETQQAIIDEIKRISFSINPRIWLGIKWLSTYIAIRPNELLSIKEEHIERRSGLILIPHPKEKRPKIVPLIDEDMELLKSFPPSFPKLYFFRHEKTQGRSRAGSQFGEHFFYSWWKRACKNLGIEDVDLYGGTRHSSAIALTSFATPEQIRRATMHATNSAFERYYQVTVEEVRNVYQATRCDTAVIPKKKSNKR